ncbi:MAG: hypothetical protein JKP95_01190 [Oceanicaulis sp.]|nr:hypothetical protein [Oceanicaulis sp.]
MIDAALDVDAGRLDLRTLDVDSDLLSLSLSARFMISPTMTTRFRGGRATS